METPAQMVLPQPPIKDQSSDLSCLWADAARTCSSWLLPSPGSPTSSTLMSPRIATCRGSNLTEPHVMSASARPAYVLPWPPHMPPKGNAAAPDLHSIPGHASERTSPKQQTYNLRDALDPHPVAAVFAPATMVFSQNAQQLRSPCCCCCCACARHQTC